jgi:adenylate cyclase
MITPSDILEGKVLIVDDKEANVLLLERMLRGAGYSNVTSTMLPDEVCELHLQNHYDLILLDLEMPRMDGFQVMENLKEIEVDGYLPVLVITAQPGHKLRALKAGAKDFVSKPFDLAEVLIRVQNMLEVRLLHRETKRLYSRLVDEQRASERLLTTVLPQSITERLKARAAPRAPIEGGSEIVAESYAEVAVLFADIVEFTRFSEGVNAEVLIGVLNDLAARLESEAGQPTRDNADVDTMGNAYLAAMGLPGPQADHAVASAQKGVDLVRALDRFNKRSRYQLKVRIGLHTSDNAAGVVTRRTLLFEV